MNERIKELAEQAGFEITPWGNESVPCVHQEGPIDVELEKFAELIVQECIERVRLQYIPVRDQLVRTEHEQGIVECGVASVIALEELVQESTEQWYKENILGDSE